jgi:transposase
VGGCRPVRVRFCFHTTINRDRGAPLDSLTELFCLIDDFCRVFEPAFEQHLLTAGQKKRRRPCELSLAEQMTLLVLFHQRRFRQFKAFYMNYVCRPLRAEFPRLPSDQRCVEFMPRCVVPLTALFQAVQRLGHRRFHGPGRLRQPAEPQPSGLREPRRARQDLRWFYGFKRHLIINSKGERLRIQLTPGNTDDRKPLPTMCEGLFGQIFADKGYVAQWLTVALAGQGIQLITKLKKNMKPVPLTPFEKAILRRRSLIETVIDELKNQRVQRLMRTLGLERFQFRCTEGGVGRA